MTGKNTINKEYNKIVDDLEKHLFHKRNDTTDIELDKVGKHFFGKEWGGCHAEDDKVKLNPTQKYYIFNTDKKTGAGVHWVALYVDYPTKTVYIYSIHFIVKFQNYYLTGLYVEIKSEHMNVKSGAHEKHQRDCQNDCGQRSMAYLLLIKKFGVKPIKYYFQSF